MPEQRNTQGPIEDDPLHQEPKVKLASETAATEDEADPATPIGMVDPVGKTVREAGAGETVVDKVGRAARELDRQIGGEYERRQDQAARERAAKQGG